ncbi:MAG: Gldg family protein [Candidatus Pseudobacter hemicellulosilyticus]|uniref:Gldg family protein n=1 Tax=Candidatus Pseudobacter hemicellulosilyticus TaxID=3121375 RepID=A0AAJ5WSH0_9BACT|nr:MAG: Gldg family protein [Pseudobacter sp.]
MKTIYRIAKAELGYLFYSPLAWLVLIVFLFQSALQFTSLLQQYESSQQVGYALHSMTRQLFTNPYAPGIFMAAKYNLYLYIPLLTMGLLSREISSGSVKLLLSSPVRIIEIVLGKYLAMLLYGLLMMLSLLLFVLVAGGAVQAIDYGLLLSGLLGLFLLLSAYAAIGLFMSSLTGYQVVAAIATLVIFAVLNYIGTLWQDIDLVRDLTYFLSIAGRSDQLIQGLISSKDLFYFGIVITLFLGFTMLKLLAGRESKPALVRAGRYTWLFLLALTLGYFSSRAWAAFYYDATITKSQTLTPPSQAIAQKIKGPVRITTYVNLLDRFVYYCTPRHRNADIRRYEQYTRFIPDMEFREVYYYDSSQYDYVYKANPGLDNAAIALKVAQSLEIDSSRVLSPALIRKQADLRPEENRVVKIIEWAGKRVPLRMFEDMRAYPSEAEISAALKRLTDGSLKVGFLSGQLERNISRAGDKDYKKLSSELTFRHALVNQGFEVVEIPAGGAIPDDCAILVLADPRYALPDSMLWKLNSYIHKGGNLLLAAEPDRKAVTAPLFRQLGLELEEGQLAMASEDYAPDFVQARFSAMIDIIDRNILRNASEDPVLTMPGVSAIRCTDTAGFHAIPILQVDTARTWLTSQAMGRDSSRLPFRPAMGDRKGSFTTVWGLSRQLNGREQRIVVAGDADFISNAELGRSQPINANFVLLMGLFRWISEGEYPVDCSRPDTDDTKIFPSAKGIVRMKIILMGVLPAGLVIFSTVLLLRRKRK